MIGRFIRIGCAIMKSMSWSSVPQVGLWKIVIVGSFTCGLPGLVPILAAVDEAHHQQHHRHFDQYADDGGQRGVESRLPAPEQRLARQASCPAVPRR